MKTTYRIELLKNGRVLNYDGVPGFAEDEVGLETHSDFTDVLEGIYDTVKYVAGGVVDFYKKNYTGAIENGVEAIKTITKNSTEEFSCKHVGRVFIHKTSKIIRYMINLQYEKAIRNK